jgi:putative SOS response-associated peptidase YedK
VAERPAFRRGFESFRCLILADGFYEWRPGADGRKEAFHITRGDGGMFSFAGLWSVWRPRADHDTPDQDTPGQLQDSVRPEGAGVPGELRSCTILTTMANDVVAPLHDRMPVILPREAEEMWLDRATPAPALHDLLRPLAADETVVRPVGPAVNDVRYDGPECLAPPTPRQAALF